LLAEYRLVTVTGPGGVGKTRLASEVARRTVSRFADGAWLAELAHVLEPAQVAAAILTTLGLPKDRDMPPGQQLAAVMARQQVLLVLDNCEHVLSAVGGLCSDLLSAADDIHILATSREAMGIPGEIRYRLEPLRLPSASERFDREEPDATALFAERARRADRRFTLDGKSRPAVERIVRRLDGMPLAIELGSTDRGDGLFSVPVHLGGVRLRVYYTAESSISTVWLLHGYDIAADPASERAAREASETEVARGVLASRERQRRAR